MSGDGDDERGPDDEADADRDPPASRVASLSLDAALELLANYDRRRVLGYLRDDSDGTATVEELVDHVVEKRSEGTDEPDPDRVLFGSGSPSSHPNVAVMEILTLDVPEDAMRKVFDKNARRVLGDSLPQDY